jgi:crotonobetainyl-CoA:carnitine CoA-transferase CaiB-like acyl-CoA transferase
MSRKGKEVREEAAKALARLREIEEIQQLAEKEDAELLENTEQAIKDLCGEHGIFCGVILTPEDLTNVITLAIKTGQNVKIQFKLYFND